jgi:hypothetical protein
MSLMIGLLLLQLVTVWAFMGSAPRHPRPGTWATSLAGVMDAL